MIDISLEQIMEPTNIELAIDYLGDKRDSCGPDGMPLSSLNDYWRINGKKISQEIISGGYHPGVVNIVELINYKGKKRKISIMNSLDRLILRAILQKVQRDTDKLLQDNCHAFREGKGVQSAISQVCDYLENGATWVVNIDLKDYFDSIPISKMHSLIDRTFSDVKLAALLKRYITVKVEEEHYIRRKRKGILQGSPLSPLLSNLYLSDFDEYYYKNGVAYCRYSDDINIYCHDLRDAEKIYEKASNVLEKKYALKINSQKSGINKALEDTFLGYNFLKDKKSGVVTAVKNRGENKSIYNRWQREGIKKVDRNYHLVNDGILTKKDYTVLFENESGKKYLPVETTDSITAYSNIIFSSDFFGFLNDKNVTLSIVDRYGNQIGNFVGVNSNSRSKVMLRQAELYLNNTARLSVAKSMENAILHNINANLKYYARRNKSEKIMNWLNEYGKIRDKVNGASDINGLLMIEARCRQKYYSLFNEIINDETYVFKDRTRRPPKDELNAMISFGNTILYNRIATEISKSSLDIRIGIIHSTTNRSQSLNLDIADIFKPIIVDRTIFTLINRRVLDKQRDFVERPDGAIYLSMSGKRIFLGEFNNKLYQKLTESGRSLTYDTKIKQEISKLYRMFMHGEKYTPYRYTN